MTVSATKSKAPEGVSEFMLAVLVAQKSHCDCQPCEILRGMADQIITQLQKKPITKKKTTK